jgi:uncharacterized protein
MILESDFTVSAPPDRVWPALLDLEALAASLPGASLEPVDGDAALQGTLRPQLGGAEVECFGALRAVDADEDGRNASAALRVREAAGPGFATALLRGRVEASDGGARVVVTVDGRVAAPGVTEDAAQPEAERLLGELVAGWEQRVAERAARPVAEPIPAEAPAAAPAPSPDRPPLAPPSPAERRGLPVPVGAAGAVGAAAVAGLAAVLLGRRKRRSAVFEIRYRW